MTWSKLGAELDQPLDTHIEDLGDNDNKSCQQPLPHPLLGLQSSSFDMISLITLLIKYPKDNYEPFSWNEIDNVD